ncbi:MAG: metal-dependent hydrolase [Oceanidesulfovibrio sp.]
MNHTITWHGHSNFQLTSGDASVIIDPFFEGNAFATVEPGSIETLDGILVTHDHGDHVGQAVELARRTGAMVGAVVGTAGKLMDQGVPQEQILNGIGFNIGGSVQVKSVTVTMTQAYHSSESGVAVGYILTFPDGYTVYHAGDTGIFAGMELWGQLYSIDLALLPIGGVFTMDPRQAAMACRLLQCDCVAPMHWGTFPVLEESTTEFERLLKQEAPDCEMLHLTPGKPTEIKKASGDTCGCH